VKHSYNYLYSDCNGNGGAVGASYFWGCPTIMTKWLIDGTSAGEGFATGKVVP